jgi:hypothetical protein
MWIARRAGVIAAVLGLLVPAAASAQVGATLKASRVKSRLRMWLVPPDVANGRHCYLNLEYKF